DRLRHYRLHLLGDHADIGLVAAVVGEAIEAKAVVEVAEQHDVVLEGDVRAATAAAASAAPAATEAAATAAAHARAAATTHTRATAADARAGAAEARRSARRLAGCGSSRRHLHRVVACTGAAARRAGRRARPLRRPVGCSTAAAGTVGDIAAAAARTVGTCARARTCAATRPIGAQACAYGCARACAYGCACARTQHLVAATAAEVHPILRAVADVVVAEALLDIRVVVAHALAMLRIVLPVVAGVDVVDVDGAVGDDVAVAPIHPAAPDVVARAPPPDQVTGAEADAGANDAGADIAGITPGVRRIVRIRPTAIDPRGLVVGHVALVRTGLLDGDDLLAAPTTAAAAGRRDRHLLLLGGLQLVVLLRPVSQPLDRVHHVRLLSQHRIAELLRPVELVAHHLEGIGCCREALDAVVPALLVDRGLERIALEILVLVDPTGGLHDLERIGRRHEHQGQQRVGVERDRRDERVELLGLEQLVARRRRRGARRLRH